MKPDTPEEYAFLNQLYAVTGSDTEVQASMYDIGDALGLDRTEAAKLAEALYIQGYAEMKTLSGGMGITGQGLSALDAAPAAGAKDDSLTLGSGTVLADTAGSGVSALVADIKTETARLDTDYPLLEELVLDVKILELHLLSPRPKTAIVREIFRSLHRNLEQAGAAGLAARLSGIIAS